MRPKMSMLSRILLLCTFVRAANQVAVGITIFDELFIAFYTVAFVLLVACLLITIFGFETLENPWIVIFAGFTSV